jgi:hypothetical protein
MNRNVDPEEERLAGELADRAVRDLALDDEERALLATMLEIDLLVHPVLAGVLRSEALARSHLGPSGTVSREGKAPAASEESATSSPLREAHWPVAQKQAPTARPTAREMRRRR